jgi:hypothetical protein
MKNLTEYSFDALLVRPEGVGTWTYLNIPAEISSTFNTKNQVRVKGTVNGHPYRSTALPSGDGGHYLVVGRDIRDQIQAKAGDVIQVTIEIDLEERRVVIPDDLAQALAGRPQGKSTFERLTYSHQKEYLDWIESAKKPETRARRIEKTIEGVLAGKNIRDIR